MQNAKILNIAAIALCLAAVVAVYFVTRIRVGETRAIAIDGFPKQIAQWKAIVDRPEDAGLKAELPSAHMVERIYQDPQGHQIDLLLLTSTDPQDFHDPTVCLPSQGWDTLGQSSLTCAGHPVHQILARLEDRVVNLMFWPIGDFASQHSTGTLRALYKIRSKMVKTEEGTCLIVRIISHGDAEGQQEALQFIDAIQPSIAALRPLQQQVASR